MECCIVNSLLDKSAVERYLQNSMWRNIEYKHTINSTNTYLKQKHDLKCGDAVVAEMQTDGRGRRGRTWYSPKGNLYMSMCVSPGGEPYKAPLAGLAAAVGAVETISAYGVECKIKWPNDIVVDGKKLCGILSELTGDGKNGFLCIVGIGINLSTSNFDAEVINPAVSLCEVYNGEFDINKFTADFLLEFEKCLNDVNMLEKYKKYCVNIGRAVKITNADGEFTADAVDINENGNLLVKTANGVLTVCGGEVSVRGIYGYCD